MDRFIALLSAFVGLGLVCLKSNMDRFIVKSFLAGVFIYTRLKSNMDRFIVSSS